MTEAEKYTQAEIDQLCINAIRFLSVDAVQKANSGHPGMPLDAATMAYVLWTRCMKYNPANPEWFDRDRFILSAGHGSMLLYSMLHLTGYDLSLDQIRQFRQWGSITPGHPERGLTPGVEATTGPLGQGFGNAAGEAIAEAYLSARYNRPGYPTHQSIEHVAGLRAIPNLTVIRPADANETAEAWRFAIMSKSPVVLVLTRQNVPTLNREKYAPAKGLHRGAYILKDAATGNPDIILIGTGSEVSLVADAQNKLEEEHIAVRAISMPSWEIFESQPEEYRNSVFPASVSARLAVEAGAPQGWEKYTGERGDILSVDHFGASAPGPVVLREFGFTVENVCKKAHAVLRKIQVINKEKAYHHDH